MSDIVVIPVKKRKTYDIKNNTLDIENQDNEKDNEKEEINIEKQEEEFNTINSHNQYSNHNILYEGISATDLFKKWQNDRQNLNDNLNGKTILTLFDNIFPRDINCKGYLGAGGRPFVMNESCVGCQLIKRLFKRGEESKNKSIFINDKEIYIQHISTSIDSFKNYTEESYSNEYAVKILPQLFHMNSCEQGYSNRVKNTKTFGTNSLISNYILISSILEQEYKSSKLPFKLPFLWIYECGDGLIVLQQKIGVTGNFDILTKHSDYLKSPTPVSTINKTKSLRTDVAKLLLMQLVINLLFLNTYDFTHGEPCIKYLIISKESCSMKYENIKLEVPFTLNIIPSYYSSLTLNIENSLTRIFYSGNFINSPLYLSQINKILFSVELGTTLTQQNCKVNNSSENNQYYCDEYISKRVLTYKIGSDKIFDITCRNMGIALFPSSFDTYAFFVSLMNEEAFYQAIIHDENLLSIWKNMWKSSEYSDMMIELTNLRKNHKIFDYFIIRSFLGKFYLRCDGLQFLWQMLKIDI
jgi:hypothetical protein